MSYARLLLQAVLVAGAVTVASSAPAQLAPGYSGSSSVQVFADEESTRTLVAFGNCFAREYPDQVLALMATAPGSRQEAAIFRRIVRLRASFCLGDTQLQMPLWI